MDRRIIVIGGGPGGYAAALKAAQLGADVSLAESDRLGGTCLNEGCIPTKSLLRTGGIYRQALNGVPGVSFTGVSLDWHSAQAHKELTVKRLTGGLGTLLKTNGVTVYNERAVPLSGKRVKIGNTVMEADAVILASGSRSVTMSFPGAELPCVLDSSGALSLSVVPESIVIAGGGVVGVELAYLYNTLGSKITLVEILPDILPSFDTEIAAMTREMLSSSGIDVFTDTKVIKGQESDSGMSVGLDTGGKTRTVSAQYVITAAGRRPDIDGLGLEDIGVRMTHGAIDTDEFFRTSVPGLYAVGDCNGQKMLAHAAMAQGVAAAAHICGETPRYNKNAVPSCVYTAPEIASVGMTEREVQSAGIVCKVGRFSLTGNGKAVIEGEDGFIKVIADSKYGEILGVHMIGPRVTEMIAEAALCIGLEGTAEDLAAVIRAHPTVSEATGEAAMAVFGKPIHGF